MGWQQGDVVLLLSLQPVQRAGLPILMGQFVRAVVHAGQLFYYVILRAVKTAALVYSVHLVNAPARAAMFSITYLPRCLTAPSLTRRTTLKHVCENVILSAWNVPDYSFGSLLQLQLQPSFLQRLLLQNWTPGLTINLGLNNTKKNRKCILNASSKEKCKL